MLTACTRSISLWRSLQNKVSSRTEERPSVRHSDAEAFAESMNRQKSSPRNFMRMNLPSATAILCAAVLLLVLPASSPSLRGRS
jgi:hypothetical protein